MSETVEFYSKVIIFNKLATRPQIDALLPEVGDDCATLRQRLLDEGLLSPGQAKKIDGLFEQKFGHSPALPSTSAPARDTAPAQAAPARKKARARPSGSSRRIDELFLHMIDAGASDLHLSAGQTPHLRIDGDVQPIADRPALASRELEELFREIMPERNQRQFADTNDTDFAYELEGAARFRCNVFRDRRGTGGVFRIIPTDILTAQQLGLPKKILELCQLSKGLVLVTGPTGSGKSTTLAALIDHINQTRNDHLITIEDPIEFVHESKRCLVNQREVAVQTHSFKSALRAALREDPDIVLVGEMRDLETTEIAIETAETGHLVFATLHTSTAASTVDRLIDQFPADRQSQIRTMLAASLKGVISQTLCKKQGGGRVAAIEVMMVTAGIANNIRDGKTHQIPSAIQTGIKYGMQLLNNALLDLVRKKLVAPEQAYLKAVDKQDLLTQFKEKGISYEPKDEVA